MIDQLTRRYAQAFAAKDIHTIAEMMSDDFQLTDPMAHVEGKEAALAEVQKIFDSNPKRFVFRPMNIYVDGETSVMEFVFEIEGTMLKGADIIEWKEGLMTAVRAYVYAA